MSERFSPKGHKTSPAIGKRTGRPAFVTMVRFLPIVAMVALGFAMMPEAGCGHGVFPEVSTAGSATPTPVPVPTTVPSATPTAAPIGTTFNMRGSSTQTGAHAGTCSGATCLGPRGRCECTTFEGTASSSLGTLHWTADVTVTTDDCPSTGNLGGLCCTGDGTFTATSGSGKSASNLVLAFTGPDCIDTTNSFASSLEANFTVLPASSMSASSTGKFANSTGTGQFNLFSASSNGSGYVFALGQILVRGK